MPNHPQTHSSHRSKSEQHWRFNCRVIVTLCVVGFVLTVVPIYFAQHFAHLTLLGWPLPFFLMAFGLPVLYLAIIALYAWIMQRREANRYEQDPT